MHLYVLLAEDILVIDTATERAEARRRMSEDGVAELPIWQGGPEDDQDLTGDVLRAEPEGQALTPDFIATLLASYLENHASDDVAAEGSALDAALDEHVISVAAHDDGAFRLDFAGKRFIVRVMVAP